MIPQLHPFQLDLAERVREARLTGKRIIIMQGPTGSGKTSTAAYLAMLADEKLKRVLFLVHRRRLVDQISQRLSQFEIRHGVLMRGEPYYGTNRVYVGSRDTFLSRCVNNEWIGMPPADLVFVDEGRHAHDPEGAYRKILSYYPQATIVLMDATPVAPDGSGLGPWAEALVCSKPTTELVSKGYLSPVKCFAPDRKIKRNGKQKRGIAGDLVDSWKEHNPTGKPTVLFVSRVAHSYDAIKAFADEGITFTHIDAKTPDEERDLAFDNLAAGRIAGVSNVGIVGEGVDVPEIGCVQFYCEVNSRTKWLQGCGRAMRVLPNKDFGIIIDHVGACFLHGFPDEDQEWTLKGNVDEEYKAKHDAGLTPKPKYCAFCELVYHKTEACPQCGRQPVKPPRSVFAPPPVESTDEPLFEADRGGDRAAWVRDEKIRHWCRCLGVAGHRNGTFNMARMVYRRKYREWPGVDFPFQPDNPRLRVEDVYPDFARRRAKA